MVKTRVVWEKLKRLAAVTVITVLIWLITDQYVSQERSFAIPVRVISLDPTCYTAIDGPPYHAVLNVTMVGRRRHLADFADLLNARDFFDAVLDESAVSPEPLLLSAHDDILGKIEAIRESHLSIKSKSVLPATVAVRIDDYEEISSVVVAPDYGDLEIVNPSCKPDKVSVRLPRFARVELLGDQVLRPKVAAAIREATRKQPDYQLSLPLTLDVDPTLGVQITPGMITLSGVVEAQNDTVVKGPVQITFSIPDDVQNRFAVVANPGTQFRQSIEVVGRKGLLGQLDPRDIRAFVDVMAADMDQPGKEITRRVRYVLPPGFTRPPDAVPHEITFKLVPRPAAASGGG